MTQQPTTSTQQPPEEPRPLGDQLKLAGAGAVALALVIFFFQNLEDVKIRFLFWDWQTDMVWALIFSALMGSVSTFLVSWMLRRRDRTPRERD
jgi:uncharacterized integral membrane protein